MSTFSSPERSAVSVQSAVVVGHAATAVTVRAVVSDGGPSFTVKGIPSHVERGLRDRLRAAVINSGVSWPQGTVVVSLEPQVAAGAACLDLPIAVAALAAAGDFPAEWLAGVACFGELGVDGMVRRVPGAIPLIEALHDAELLILPEGEALAATMVASQPFFTAVSLSEVIKWEMPRRMPPAAVSWRSDPPDGVCTDEAARIHWGLEVAVAGGHHVMVSRGDAASLAQEMARTFPPLSGEEARVTTRIHSAAGEQLPSTGWLIRPPVRAPGHDATTLKFIGGGDSALTPGEISLAHNGLLVLDGLEDYAPSRIDLLQGPLRHRRVTVRRGRQRAEMPADFQLLVNTRHCCPRCTAHECICTERPRYRLPLWLLDRIGVRLSTIAPSPDGAFGARANQVAERVARVRTLAFSRGVPRNEALAAERLPELAPLDTVAAEALTTLLEAGTLSASGSTTVHRVARTLADLDDQATIGVPHVLTAVTLHLGVH